MAASPLLFAPLRIRSLTLKNRIVIGPMATYAAVAGTAGDWHLAHLAKFAAGGAGLVFFEATAISRQSRITQGAAGLWQDEQTAPLLRITEFLRQQGAASAIQLAHSGAPTALPRPWDGEEPGAGDGLDRNERLWDLIAAEQPGRSEIGPPVHEFGDAYLEALLDEYELAAKRAATARFDVLEIHGGSGCLLHSFLSPALNRRGDEYGGTLEDRMRFPLEVVGRVRAAWPEERPLFYRLSPIDSDDSGWHVDDTIAFASALARRGVDVIDCASASTPLVATGAAPDIQVETTRRLGAETEVLRLAGGGIRTAAEAEAALDAGNADLLALVREVVWNPNWPLHAAGTLGADPNWGLWPPQYGWSLRRRAELEP